MTAVLGSAGGQASPAPHLNWRSIATPCCDVHFPAAQEAEGQRVAAMVDACVDNAATLLQGRLQDRLQVVLHDVTDSPNGFANVVPYNRVELRAITPDDGSELARTDDWLRLLVQHEVLHIVHLDIVHGIPAAVNLVLGKVWPPNVVQPRMFVEGLAVWAETRFTDGGRLRSTLFSAPLRLAALQGDRWSLDDASNASRRPPGFGAAYTYGAFFVDWLTRRYGTGLWAAYAHDYGGQAIPYAVQRSLESITGRDLALDWDDFLDDVLKDARRLEALTLARGGPTPSRRLTRLGGAIRRPAFLTSDTLVVGANPPDGPPGLYALRGLPAATPIPEPLVRTGDLADVAVVDDDVVFSQTEVDRQWYSFRDLFVRSADGRVRQLTWGQRLRNPARLPGTRVVVAEQRTGARSALVEVDIDSGVIDDVAVAPAGVTLYTPQPSPDGTRVAVSRLDVDGLRRLALFDRASGAWQVLDHEPGGAPATATAATTSTHGDWGLGASGLRVGEIDPTWVDDRTIVYAADDDGLFNVFLLDTVTGDRRRVVDTLGGAALPVATPDGTGVVYVDAHLDGVDLRVAALDRGAAVVGTARFVPLAAPTTSSTATPPAISPVTTPATVSVPYDPLPTLWPRTWRPELTGDPFGGVTAGVAVDGSDAAALASWTLAGTIDTTFGRPAAAGTVRLRNLSLPVSLQAEYRPQVLTRGRLNDGTPEFHIETQLRAGASLTVPLRRRRFSHSLAFGTQRVVTLDGTGVTSSPDAPAPIYPASVVNPSQQVFTLDWFYSSTEQYRDSVSTERGLSINARGRVADRLLLSDTDIREVFVDVRAFQPVPGLGNHVVAVTLTGGATFDDRPGSLFFLGGFVNRSLLDDLIAGRRSGGGVLRGFPIGHIFGDSLAAATIEYRLPLLEIERGIETLPVFVDRLHGAVFVDTATAFNERASLATFASGIGAELRLQLTLGYYGNFMVRAGYARGLTPGGVDQPYTVLGFAY